MLLISAVLAVAQPVGPDTSWCQLFGDTGDDIGYCIQATSDGGYIVAGDYNLHSIWLMKLDSEGTLEWERLFGDDYGLVGLYCVETPDGGYVVTGGDYGTSGDTWLVKTDAAGNELWTRYYQGQWYLNMGYCVQNTLDGGFVVLARTGYSEGYYSYCGINVIKTDAYGNEVWNATYGSAGDYNQGFCIESTDDGGYVIAGNSHQYGSLFKIDGNGAVSWTTPSSEIYGRCVKSTLDGGFVVSGDIPISGGDWDFAVFKTDTAGSIEWEYTYNWGEDDPEASKGVVQTEDGHFVLGGYGYSPSGYDVILLKINSSGQILWESRVNLYEGSRANSMARAEDYGYIIAGVQEEAYSERCLVMKFDGPVQITSVPLNPPVTVPAEGGSFDFSVNIVNTDSYRVNFDTWSDVTLPDSSTIGPIAGPAEITLTALGSINRERTQVVPANTPPGIYHYNVCIGDYPDIWEKSSFEVEKLTNNDPNAIMAQGKSLQEDQVNLSIPIRIQVDPNPFNPTTTISYQLPVAGFVSLKVYDLQGREVADLINGYRQAGSHEITFDGSNLTSGIYFYRLKAGDFNAIGKMVLMK